MGKYRKKILDLSLVLALILFMGGIYFFSSQDGMKSNHTTLKMSENFDSPIKKEFKGGTLKLVRKGKKISAYSLTMGMWWKIGETVEFNPKSQVYLGLAVTSHNSDKLCSAIFTDVKMVNKGNTILSLDLTNKDIGHVKIKGSTEQNDGKYTVKGSGKDIWAGGNEFQYAYIPVDGDFTIIAKLVSIDNTHKWAKAGILMRDSLEPLSGYAGILMTPEDLVSFQWRDKNEPKQISVDNQVLFTNYLIRKSLHFSEYFILALLAYFALGVFLKVPKKRIIYAGILCFLYASSDEFHQLFVSGRTASPIDVLIDTMGALLGLTIIYLINKKQNK